MKTAETQTNSSAQARQGNTSFFGMNGESFFEKPIQAKLKIGNPNDRYEKEADAMADKAIQRLPTGDIDARDEKKVQSKVDNLSQSITPLIQSKCAHCEEEKKENLQRKPIFESETDEPIQRSCFNGPVESVQPKCEHCEEEDRKHGKDTVEDVKSVQRTSCRECEEGDKVLMKPMSNVQRSEEDQTPKNDGSRTSILAAAKGELGKVNARLNDGSGQRVGADRLNEYFKIAAPNVWDESIITTAGAEMPSWCGIFSVWAHKKAGKDLGNWQMGKGVSAFGTLTNTTTPQPGDIGYIHKTNQHHAIVKEINGDNVVTIDGNSGINSEVKENTKPRSAYTLFMTAFGGGGSTDVQKKEEDENIQSKKEGDDSSASFTVENRLSQSKGQGASLPEPTRKGMEQSFQADFSNVRIHTDSNAKDLSKNLRAQAFTHGNDIYFNSGKFDTSSDAGKHLLAHELTHVIQQNGPGDKVVQKKDETTLCNEDGKNRPKSKPSASSILLQKYTHLAKVIPTTQLEMMQKALDAQFKVSELREKQKPFKDKVHRGSAGHGGDSAMVAKYLFYENQISQQLAIVSSNSSFDIDSKLLAADDIKRPDNEDNEVILAFHEQLYKRFTEKPVRVTTDPCQVTENNQFNIFLKYGWLPVPQTIPWQLPHTSGLVTFRNLMVIQRWNIDYQKVVVGEMVKILDRMVELRREMGDTYNVSDQKLGYIYHPFFNDDVTLGYKLGNNGGYPDDGRGRMAMNTVFYDAANAGTARVVLKSPTGWLHIYRVNPNFDTLEMTSPDNDGNLLVIDKRATGITVYDNLFYTKDGRQLKEGKSWFYGPVWSTPRELSELEEFAIGAILGDAFESNSGTATFGQIVIGLIPIVGQIADARDVCVGIYKMWETGGKDGKMQTAFALIGFVPLFGDWIKRAAKVSKNAPDAVKLAAKTDAVSKGAQELGGGVSHQSAKKIENATEKSGKKGAQEALEALPKVEKPFVKQVMQEAGKVTDESASAIGKTGNAATDAASAAHGRPLSDLSSPKVLSESSFKVGETVHTVKVVEIGNMKQIWLCTTCGQLVGKIDNVLEGAKGPAVERLRKIREAAAELERKVTNGDVKPHDVDGKVRDLARQMNDLARQNPDMAGLTKFMREDLEKQYKLLNNVDDVSKLSDGAKEALRLNYEHPPNGYFWRLDGQNLEVVRKSDGVARPKLVYDIKTHRFIEDLGATTAARFGDVKAVDAFIELGGRDANKDFGKFAKTVLEELGVTETKLIEDLGIQNPKGFKDAVQDSVRHKLKSTYIDNLFTLITDAKELSKKAVFKEVLAKTGNINEALRAASHEELMRIGQKLGPSDKGSLGERWFKGWFADRGETVAKQVTLGPEHGIKHAASRRVDIFEDHLAREMKNVTTHVGTEGANQLEDLVAGIGKKVTVDGAATGYDSVRWVFLDPVGGSANAGWMVEQLGKFKGSNVSFQILNSKGSPRVITSGDLSKMGADKLKKYILDWVEIKPKTEGITSSLPEEREADHIADKVMTNSRRSFFGVGNNLSEPFFKKSGFFIQREESCQGPAEPDASPPVCVPEEDQSTALVCEQPPIVNQQFGEASSYSLPEEQVCNVSDTPTIQDTYVEFTVQQSALVNARDGIRLHTTPDTEDYDYKNKLGKSSIVYARYDPVTIVGIGKIPVGVKSPARWAKIRTNSGQEGWIERRFLNEYDASDNRVWKYHIVEKGDKVVKIIQKHYYDIFDIKYGQDERAVAQAISYLNKDNTAVYHHGEYDSSIWKDDILDSSMEETRRNFQTIKLRENGLLKLPTGAYIHELIDLGHVSSRPAWKNTVFKIGRSIQGFLQGVVEGFIGAAVDMVTGLWDLVKSIVTGDIVDQAEALYDTVSEMGWSGLWDLLKEAFFGEIIKLKKWIDGENPQKKWWAIGKIVGMIVFEIVLAIFTMGIGTALKVSARVGKVLTRVQKITSKIPGLRGFMNRSRGRIGKIDHKVKQEVVGKFDTIDLHKEKSFKESLNASVKKPGKALTHTDMKSEAEWLTKNQNLLEPSSIEGYVDQIELPNGTDWTEKHFWRRDKQGHWCRFSEPQCITSKEAEDLGLNIVEERSARLSTNLDEVNLVEKGEISIEREVNIGGKKKTVPGKSVTLKVHEPTSDPVANMKLITEKNILFDVSNTKINITKKLKINPDFVPDQILGPGNKLVKNTEKLSNRQIAAKGNTPYIDHGVPVELHHTTNNFFGEVEELSTSFHKSVNKDLDHHPMADDPAYISWRHEYGVYNGKRVSLEDVYTKQRQNYWKNRL